MKSKKVFIEKKRIKAFSDFFSTRLCFDNWVGTVQSLDTDIDGDAILGIDIGGFIFLNYADQAIPMSNSLFDTVAEMEEDDKVVLSGGFSKHIDEFADNWYLFAHEKTENGAMTYPTFQGSYSDIKKSINRRSTKTGKKLTKRTLTNYTTPHHSHHQKLHKFPQIRYSYRMKTKLTYLIVLCFLFLFYSVVFGGKFGQEVMKRGRKK